MAITVINMYLLFDLIHLSFMTKMSVIEYYKYDNGNNSILNIKKWREKPLMQKSLQP